MYIVPDEHECVISELLHILRGASACLLVQRIRAIPEPRNVGRATVQTSRFLYNNTKANERVPRQLIKNETYIANFICLLIEYGGYMPPVLQ